MDMKLKFNIEHSTCYNIRVGFKKSSFHNALSSRKILGKYQNGGVEW